MPCLNEIETLPKCIAKAKEWASKANHQVQILIADNGSTDGSVEYALAQGIDVTNVMMRGYGAALFQGCTVAKGDWIIMGDSDDSYDFSNLTPFVEQLENGYELVMGNRFLGGIEDGAMPWKNRYIGNPVLTKIGKVLFSSKSNDFHCGIRAITKVGFNKLDLRTTGMEFASEMVIKATLLKLNICEVPTTLSKDGRSRPPHLRPWRDGWRHLKFMLMFSPDYLFLYPGYFTFIISTIASCFIFINGKLKILNVEFSNNSLIYLSVLSILGLSSILFSFLVKSIGLRDGLFKVKHITKGYEYLMEYGVILAFAFAGFGVYLGQSAVSEWGGNILKSDINMHLYREVALSAYLIAIGGVLFLFSLTAGFMSLPVRRAENASF